MEQNFMVYCQGKACGTAGIALQGLYYHIRIRCPKPDRVRIIGENGSRDLGICVPMETGFGIDTRIPVKQVGLRNISFQTDEEVFYPVISTEPFLALDKLRSGFLTGRNGQMGIQISISNPTGQWSEPIISE